MDPCLAQPIIKEILKKAFTEMSAVIYLSPAYQYYNASLSDERTCCGFCNYQKKGRMDEEKIETMLTDLATIKKFE